MLLKYNSSLFTLIFIFLQATYAQQDSLKIHQINNKDYYIHEVEKGGSLYSIHKKYNVPIDIIKKENPSVLDGLSIGEKIFIPVKKNTLTTNQSDGNFITHEVKKKQTLYSIAQLYQLKQKEILVANPEISGGLKEGMIIKIPVGKIKKSNKKGIADQATNYKSHLIKKGETFYSLSKQYDVSIDSIRILNHGLKKGLKVGETIFIPLKEKPSTTNLLAAISDTTKHVITKKPIYKIGLMLPFYLDKNDEMLNNHNAFRKKGIYPKSRFAIEFYNGFLMALDTLSSDSIKFQLYVYDTNGKDSLRTKELLEKEEFKSFDLIVGPLYSSNFEKASKFAKQHQIPITSPVKQTNRILLGNEYVFKAIPSKTTAVHQVVNLMIDSFKMANLIAIENPPSKEKALIPLLIKLYNKQLLTVEDTLNYSAIKIVTANHSFDSIIDHLSMDKENVLFIPVTDQTYITNLFNYLVNTLNKNDYKLTVIGQEEWLNYDNIDLAYFQQLNVHFCAPQYVDCKDSFTDKIIKKYIATTATYPSKNALLGYDLGMFFGNHFITNGTLFHQNFSANTENGVSLKINFHKTGVESGYENTSSCLLKFDDYVLKKVYR